MIKQMDADDIKPLRNIDKEVQAIDEELMNGEEDNVQ
jgi:hypothetical protein